MHFSNFYSKEAGLAGVLRLRRCWVVLQTLRTVLMRAPQNPAGWPVGPHHEGALQAQSGGAQPEPACGGAAVSGGAPLDLRRILLVRGERRIRLDVDWDVGKLSSSQSACLCVGMALLSMCHWQCLVSMRLYISPMCASWLILGVYLPFRFGCPQ